MPKYYCDYCKSYLTHDTMSVRKSHLMGKNHIKYYCNYYELKAKETGIWARPDKTFLLSSYVPYTTNEPGSDKRIEALLESIKRDQEQYAKRTPDGPSDEEDQFLQELATVRPPPPPPTIEGFPKPPPSVLRIKGDHHLRSSFNKRSL